MILVHSTFEYLEEAAENISSCDLEEFNKMQEGRDLKATLRKSLGSTSRTILNDRGEVLATGGSNECLWFVTTTHVDTLSKRERLQLVLMLRRHLEEVRKVLPADQMSNFVYEHNFKHRRLLDALGARYGFYQEYSPAGHPFRQFWL